MILLLNSKSNSDTEVDGFWWSIMLANPFTALWSKSGSVCPFLSLNDGLLYYVKLAVVALEKSFD